MSCVFAFFHSSTEYSNGPANSRRGISTIRSSLFPRSSRSKILGSPGRLKRSWRILMRMKHFWRWRDCSETSRSGSSSLICYLQPRWIMLIVDVMMGSGTLSVGPTGARTMVWTRVRKKRKRTMISNTVLLFDIRPSFLIGCSLS
jgi:hypothetical protein